MATERFQSGARQRETAAFGLEKEVRIVETTNDNPTKGTNKKKRRIKTQN